jgi:ABC-2 type transport system permease protein
MRMQEPAESPPAAHTPAGTAPPAQHVTPRQPSLLHLVGPKWRGGRRRMAAEGSAVRMAVLGFVGVLFFAGVFGVVYRLLAHFRATPGVGDLLAEKLLALVLLAFLSILLLSNIITALSSFFLARDLELLAAAPVDPVRVYTARLVETTVNSSWMMVLVLLPVLAAFGASYGPSAGFLLVVPVALAAYLVVPAVTGTALTLLLVNVFPARRARDLLALIALLGAAALIALFRLLRPEQLARPEGFRNLVDFVAALRTPQSVWLPSEWAAQALLVPLGAGENGFDLFPLLLLTMTAAAFFVMGAWLHGRLYRDGLSRSQEGAELQEDAGARPRLRLERLLASASPRTRSLVAKDVRTFFRDTTQWSQLILLAVLVAVYVYNVKVLPLFSGEDVGFLLTHVISFLNLGLAGFVLAAIAARFLFPAISLEGRTLWLLRSAPLDLRALLWSKYWVGIVPLLTLALALTIGTNLILRVSGFMMVLSIVTIAVMTFTIAAMALGFGALFPKFDTENAAEIPTSYGGLLFMMASTVYLGLVVALQAWPVYSILRAQQLGTPVQPLFTYLGASLALALAISLVATLLPLRLAARRIEALER